MLTPREKSPLFHEYKMFGFLMPLSSSIRAMTIQMGVKLQFRDSIPTMIHFTGTVKTAKRLPTSISDKIIIFTTQLYQLAYCVTKGQP